MYRAFNVKLNTSAFDKYISDYKSYELNKRLSNDRLKKLIASSEIVSAKEIKEIILPIKSYDIFLSHSHNDLDLALRLKKYLETAFGLKVFIDSVYWDNIDNLQEVLNEYHHNREEGFFNHQKTMQVAAHANMILASALTEMIDKCESVFFLNTNNSLIRGRDVVEGDETYSPWIYHEVYTTTIIKPKVNRRLNEAFEGVYNKKVLDKEMPQITYGLDLENMELLNQAKFNTWHYAFLRNDTSNPLDILYNLTKYKI